MKPIKIYPESQFARGGRYASWIVQRNPGKCMPTGAISRAVVTSAAGAT